MNNPLIDLAGRAILGNMWSTSIGGWTILHTAANCLNKLADGVTPAQMATDPDFLAFGGGLVSIFKSLDPKFMPQLFKFD